LHTIAGGTLPTVWPKDGPLQQLEVPVPGWYADVGAVAQDHVYAGNASSPDVDESHCTWWKDGVATMLPNSLGGNHCTFRAVDTRGRIFAGSANTSDGGDDHAVFHVDGVMHDLGAPAFGTAAANGVNVLGHVVGAWSAWPATNAFFYDGTTMSFLETPAATHSAALAVNDRDEVVGYLVSSKLEGALWVGGHLFRLTGQVIDNYAGWDTVWPNAINDDGVIVGVAQRSGDSAQHGFALVKVRDR